MSVFFDDFPVFEVEPQAALTSKVIDGFFNALGWRHAMQGKKAVDFSDAPVATGVQCQLANVWQVCLIVGNKPGRLDKILDLVEHLSTAGRGARKTAATLAGLMNFAGGFLMGHQFKLGTNVLNM